MQFRALFGLFAAMAAAKGPNVTPEQLAELSCYLVAKGVKVYDLRTLQKTDGTVYQSDGLSWNFCAYLPGTETFAALDDGTPLTGYKATVDKVTEVKNGVQTEQNGGACGSDKYTFTSVVTCNSRLQGQGAGRIDKVEGVDTCNPTVYMSHASGCKDFDPDDYSWFEQNKYYFAVFALIVGPIIAFGGKRLFPYVAATVISIFIFFMTLIVSTILGGFNSTVGVILTLLCASGIAIGTGCFIRRCFKCIVVTMGGICGLILGIVLYSVLAITLKFQSDLTLVVLCAFTSMLGGIYAVNQGEHIVVFGTSFVGSYIIMRGIAAFYGGFPDFSELTDFAQGEEELEKPTLFFLSVGIFVATTLLSSLWQYYRMNAHESLAQEGYFVRAQTQEDQQERLI